MVTSIEGKDMNVHLITLDANHRYFNQNICLYKVVTFQLTNGSGAVTIVGDLISNPKDTRLTNTSWYSGNRINVCVTLITLALALPIAAYILKK